MLENVAQIASQLEMTLQESVIQPIVDLSRTEVPLPRSFSISDEFLGTEK